MLLDIFPTGILGFIACALIVYTRTDQLLPQVLLEEFDTVPS